jgi:hypothetical protein
MFINLIIKKKNWSHYSELGVKFNLLRVVYTIRLMMKIVQLEL